ncbi:MAG: amidohydrolase [Treponema sp.]|jgi:amidohydrolase|nr:amidohydrolase [Treponema sp.]
MDSKKLALENFQYVVDFRHDLHRHPEASFEEVRTTQKIAEALDRIGLPYQKLQPTGLVGTIAGGKPGITIALRADLDALSITEKSGVEFSSENPGFMHACGHDTHASMLLGAAKALYENRAEIPGTIKVIFQPAEEIALGAKKVIEQGGLKDVDFIFGLHIMGQMPVSMIAVAEGPSAAAADVVKITVTGAATHGAMPDKGADALVAASAIVMNLQSIVSREVSPSLPLVVTIGKLTSGSRFNIVAGSAEMEGTIRSFDRDLHSRLPGIVERIAKRTAEAYRCTAEVDYQMLTEVLVNDPEAVKYTKSAAQKVVPESVGFKSMEKMMGAEDFAEYTVYSKGGFVGLGSGGTYPNHSDYFIVEEESFKTGVAWYIQVALDCLTDKAG